MLKNRLLLAGVIVAGLVILAGTRYGGTVKAASHLSFQHDHDAPDVQEKDLQDKDEPQIEADLEKGPEIEVPDLDDHDGPEMDEADHDSEPVGMDEGRAAPGCGLVSVRSGRSRRARGALRRGAAHPDSAMIR